MKKYRLSFAIALFFLTACTVQSTGTIYVNNQPAKITIEESTSNGITIDGFIISINDELIGLAERKTSSGFENNKASITFEPINSRFGVLEIQQNVSLSLAASEVSFDVFIDSKYVGTVRMAI